MSVLPDDLMAEFVGWHQSFSAFDSSSYGDADSVALLAAILYYTNIGSGVPAGSAPPTVATPSLTRITTTTSASVTAGATEVSIACIEGSGSVLGAVIEAGEVVNYPPLINATYPAIAYTVDASSTFLISVITT